MQISVENEALGRALTFVQGSIGAAESMPILEHVVLDADPGGRLRIRACDLSREAEASLPANVKVPGSTAVPGDVLASLVKKLSRKGRSDIELLDNARLALGCGASRYELRSIGSNTFPSLKPRDDAAEGVVEFSIAAPILKAMLKDTSIAALKGHPSFFSQGVHLVQEGNHLVTVATDHHRLVHIKTRLPSGAFGMPAVTIKLDAVAELLRLLGMAGDGDVGLTIRRSMIELRVGAHAMRSMLMAVDYPNYQRVIPKDDGQPRIILHPTLLADAINRAILVYARDKQEAAAPIVQMLAANDSLYIVAGKRGSETAEEMIACETNGIEADWAVNANYLLQALATMPEDAKVALLYIDQGTALRLDNDKRPEMLHAIMQSKRIRHGGIKKPQPAKNAA